MFIKELVCGENYEMKYDREKEITGGQNLHSLADMGRFHNYLKIVDLSPSK